MNALLENPAAAQLLVQMSFDANPAQSGLVTRAQRTETHAEMLAYEIVRYAPGLAKKLVQAGRNRLARAPL